MKFLVEHSADVESKDKDGRTPLSYACSCGMYVYCLEWTPKVYCITILFFLCVVQCQLLLPSTSVTSME